MPEENKRECGAMRIKSRRQRKVRKWGEREINVYGVAAACWALLQRVGIELYGELSYGCHICYLIPAQVR